MYKYDKCYFTCESAANDKLEEMVTRAIEYGCVSIADYYEICNVYFCYGHRYTDTKYGWLRYHLSNARVDVDHLGRWYISLPRAIPLDSYNIADSNEDHESQTEPQPINIAIHTNEISDLNKTLAETFKYIYTIQDRTVNLTIM